MILQTLKISHLKKLCFVLYIWLKVLNILRRPHKLCFATTSYSSFYRVTPNVYRSSLSSQPNSRFKKTDIGVIVPGKNIGGAYLLVAN